MWRLVIPNQSHPFNAGEPELLLKACIMLLLTLKARRKNAVQTSWRPATIAPFLRPGDTSGILVCINCDRPAPVKLTIAACSARRVLILPLPLTNGSTHLSPLQQENSSLAISSTWTTADTCFLLLAVGDGVGAMFTLSATWPVWVLRGDEKWWLSSRVARGFIQSCKAPDTDMTPRRICVVVLFWKNTVYGIGWVEGSFFIGSQKTATNANCSSFLLDVPDDSVEVYMLTLVVTWTLCFVSVFVFRNLTYHQLQIVYWKSFLSIERRDFDSNDHLWFQQSTPQESAKPALRSRIGSVFSLEK